MNFLISVSWAALKQGMIDESDIYQAVESKRSSGQIQSFCPTTFFTLKVGNYTAVNADLSQHSASGQITVE